MFGRENYPGGKKKKICLFYNTSVQRKYYFRVETGPKMYFQSKNSR